MVVRFKTASLVSDLVRNQQFPGLTFHMSLAWPLSEAVSRYLFPLGGPIHAVILLSFDGMLARLALVRKRKAQLKPEGVQPLHIAEGSLQLATVLLAIGQCFQDEEPRRVPERFDQLSRQVGGILWDAKQRF